MPFYLRKSVTAGPFRFNFSNAGLGVSVGVKGFRIGSGPRGHYVHAGFGGVYYRASLAQSGKKQPRHLDTQIKKDQFDRIGVDMKEIDSSAVQLMNPTEFSEILKEINKNIKKIKLSTALTTLSIFFGMLSLVISKEFGIFGFLLAIPSWIVGKWLDSYKRSTVLFYELDDEIKLRYQKIIENFDAITMCGAKWHIEASGEVRDLTTWKRNAGAGRLIRRKPTSLTYSLPAVIKCNLDPPTIKVGRQKLYLFPDIILLEDSGAIGVIRYSDLTVTCAQANFVEEGHVPPDSLVIGNTWKHPNKNGGPDRRFGNNYQIPICLYESIHFSSSSGVITHPSFRSARPPLAPAC